MAEPPFPEPREDPWGEKIRAYIDARRRVARSIVVTEAIPAIILDDFPAVDGDLVITGNVRGTAAGSNTNLWARLNGDVGANYVSERLRGNAAAASADGGAASVLRVAELTSAGSAVGKYTDFELRIQNYRKADRFKNWVGVYYLPFGSVASNIAGIQSGHWQSVAPVTRVLIFPQAGLIAAGTEITVEIVPRAAAPALAAPAGAFVVNTDGDSITASATGGGTPWPSKLFPDLVHGLGRNVAVASTTLPDMIARAAADTDPSFSSAWLSINVLFGGTNDLTLVTDPSGAEIFSRFQTYQDARGAVGWTRVATTILPRTGLSASRELARTTFNDLVRANWQDHAEALWDVAAIPELADPANLTYYVDGLHPTDVGRDVLEASIKPVLTGLGAVIA